MDTSQVKLRLANVLEGKESLSALSSWISRESGSLRYNDAYLLNLVDSILNPLQAYFDNIISESEARNEISQVWKHLS